MKKRILFAHDFSMFLDSNTRKQNWVYMILHFIGYGNPATHHKDSYNKPPNTKKTKSNNTTKFHNFLPL